MNTIYEVQDDPAKVTAHMSEDGKTPYCGAILEGDTSDQMVPNCEECDSKFIEELGRMCMHGPLPGKTQKLLMAIMYRYQARFNHAVTDAHKCMENGYPEGSALYEEFKAQFPKPLYGRKLWARDALRLMQRQGIEDDDMRKSLEQVLETGLEPYHSVKGFVSKLHSNND